MDDYGLLLTALITLLVGLTVGKAWERYKLRGGTWIDRRRALEVHMILGNLHREKGQVGKAITVHQGLLQRSRLTRMEHAYVLLCLGLDYKRGGFVDRAHEAFNEVLRLDPRNEYALIHLQKLHEEQHQWTEAYDTRRRLTTLSSADDHPQNQAILAFLENEIGLEAMRRKDFTEATRRFQAAID